MKQAMRFLFFSAGTAVAVWGQTPSTTPRGFGDLFNQAPPHVDKALRERVEKFYSLQQARKWRQADALVHEESKDVYFGAEKLTFRSFKIVGVTYEENFTRAKVVLDIDTDMFFPGFGQMQVNRPVASAWRFDKDEWWWNVPPFDPAKCKDGPFGSMFCGADPNRPVDPNDVPKIGTPGSMNDFSKAVADLQSKVQVDKTEVVLPSNEPADAAVEISNKWENPVHLSVDFPDRSGLALKIDKPELPAGEKTMLRIQSRPETRGAKLPVKVRLTVGEISKLVEVLITYLPPPSQDAKPGSRFDPATGKMIEPPAAAAAGLPKKPQQ